MKITDLDVNEFVALMKKEFIAPRMRCFSFDNVAPTGVAATQFTLGPFEIALKNLTGVVTAEIEGGEQHHFLRTRGIGSVTILPPPDVVSVRIDAKNNGGGVATVAYVDAGGWQSGGVVESDGITRTLLLTGDGIRLVDVYAPSIELAINKICYGRGM